MTRLSAAHLQLMAAVAILCLWNFPISEASKFVDLTHAQNASTVYWAGVPGFTRTVLVASTNENGVWIEVGSYASGEHGGTHVDVPRHFIPNGYDLKDMPLERTIADGVMIDCVAEAARNPDYGVTAAKVCACVVTNKLHAVINIYYS
ncbi:cyclase family protein [Elysia marginata]|uniref:Cyclase family protein n=1 Tax=Elysia marginata TaxID=1093978 RepID=A0AAV4G6S5_9GAST|nr:cyclase family protein [Elysia marginata]